MKPKNFPARKLQRQIDAARDKFKPYTDDEMNRFKAARAVRTKKRRSSV